MSDVEIKNKISIRILYNFMNTRNDIGSIMITITNPKFWFMVLNEIVTNCVTQTPTKQTKNENSVISLKQKLWMETLLYSQRFTTIIN